MFEHLSLRLTTKILVCDFFWRILILGLESKYLPAVNYYDSPQVLVILFIDKILPRCENI